ncbi:MAG: tRNA pseudouridine(13) synthase TruD [Agarilytica sp.]
MTETRSLDFAYAYGAPVATGDFRSVTEDFVVDEALPEAFSGEGEHIVVQIKKRGENTQWVADKLAQFFRVKTMDVGFCGLKDRHAETTQWFSIYLPKYTGMPNWADFISEFSLNAEVLASAKHNRKLRRGDHASNHFKIRLRNVTDSGELEERLAKVAGEGVPNYFGEQRFGREGNNLAMVQSWVDEGYRIKNRNKRSIIYSSARSYVFNRVLSERVEGESWSCLIDGDTDAQPTGPLWGRGRSNASGKALAIEEQALEPLKAWCDKLEHVGLSHERRAFVLPAEDFMWNLEDGTLNIQFRLQPGQFATSILREICHLKQVARV